MPEKPHISDCENLHTKVSYPTASLSSLEQGGGIGSYNLNDDGGARSVAA